MPLGAEDTTSPYSVIVEHHHGRQRHPHADRAGPRRQRQHRNLGAGDRHRRQRRRAGSFENEILATGFDLPTAMKFLPDGRMLVAELGGKIKVLPAPYTQADPTPFLQLTNVGSAGDGTVAQQGIYDLALDPNFATNHYYYITYTARTPNRDRLSRFTANATLTGTVAGSELIIYQDPQDANTEHHGGAINFGNDGKIYLTTGDHFQGTPSQDLTSPRGKVLRFNPDGTVPTDNPFYDGTGPNYDAVWALGLRNPYRAYYDAPTGRLLIGDVGGNVASTAIEELDVGVRGANYGWPNVEGTSSNPAYTNPIYSYRPQRTRRGHHRRLRLSRHPIPQHLPGQLLLRRLRAEHDQAPDVRCQRQRQRGVQFRARQRRARRADRRHRVSDPGPRRRPLLHRPRRFGHHRHKSASARSAGSASPVPTSRPWRRPRPTRRRARRRWWSTSPAPAPRIPKANR